MYAIDRDGAVVGYSPWAWDPLYSPIVGCFRAGRLQTFAECHLRPVKGMAGPAQPCWFRMVLDPADRISLEFGDRSVQLMRLEDGLVIEPLDPPEMERVGQIRVEDFLIRSSGQGQIKLDGFPSFVSAPMMHRTMVLFLDLLGRLPDPTAAQGYTRAMEGGMSLFDVRREIMNSQEFRDRRISVSDRIGSLMTSGMWNELKRMEPLGERRRALPRFNMGLYVDLGDRAFARAAHLAIHGDEATEAALDGMVTQIELNGRHHLASLMIRDAAAGRRYLLELIDE